MNDYAFFANYLSFVAQRTDRSDPGVAAQMAELQAIADAVVAQPDAGGFTVPGSRQQAASRALAGLAGFLQEHILPEAVAHGNAGGEKQVRWVIDTAMAASTALAGHAAATGSASDYRFRFPGPP